MRLRKRGSRSLKGDKREGHTDLLCGRFVFLCGDGGADSLYLLVFSWYPLVFSPYPLVSPPHPLVSSPHPLVSPPYPPVSIPHPLVFSPHPIVSPPHPIISPPHPIVSPPYPLVSSPHPPATITLHTKKLPPRAAFYIYDVCTCFFFACCQSVCRFLTIACASEIASTSALSDAVTRV